MALRTRRRFVQQLLRHRPRHFDEVGIRLKIGVTQQRQPGLATADKLARPTQTQILSGNFKTVIVFINDF